MIAFWWLCTRNYGEMKRYLAFFMEISTDTVSSVIFFFCLLAVMVLATPTAHNYTNSAPDFVLNLYSDNSIFVAIEYDLLLNQLREFPRLLFIYEIQGLILWRLCFVFGILL